MQTVTYQITSIRRKGYAPITVNTGLDEDTARRTAEALAPMVSAVTLTEVDMTGMPLVIGRWEDGESADTYTDRPARVIEGEVDTDEEIEVSDDEEAEDSGGTETVYCMKCHERRDVHGEIETSDAGRRRFIGVCPVCGKKVAKFLPSAAPPPEPEWQDEDPPGIVHLLQRDDAGRGKIRLFCSCDEWESTVKAGTVSETRALAAFSEHAAEADEEPADEPAEDPENAAEGQDTGEEIPEAQEGAESDEDAGAAAAEELLTEVVTEVIAENLPDGTTLPEAAEAVQVAAVAFSHDAEVAEEEPVVEAKPPRKRTKAKANPDGNSRVTDEEIKATQDLPVANCPYCKNNIPVKTGGSTGVQYLMPHPQRDANGKATGGNCTGSHATVKDGVVQ